jgi:putative flippase GtrA
MTNLVTSFIDFFYPPFRKFLNLQTFRYIVCGGTNTFLDILVYFLSYNFILHKQVVFLGPGVAVKPHIMAFLMSFVVSFPTGFYLNRYVVFTGSTLRGRVQLFRYLLLVIICVVLNYVFIKLFVEQFNIFPTVAKIFTTGIVVCFSYVTQRNFTFKKSRGTAI